MDYHLRMSFDGVAKDACPAAALTLKEHPEYLQEDGQEQYFCFATVCKGIVESQDEWEGGALEDSCSFMDVEVDGDDIEVQLLRCDMCRGCLDDGESVKMMFGDVSGRDEETIKSHCRDVFDMLREERGGEVDAGYCVSGGSSWHCYEANGKDDCWNQGCVWHEHYISEPDMQAWNSAVQHSYDDLTREICPLAGQILENHPEYLEEDEKLVEVCFGAVCMGLVESQADWENGSLERACGGNSSIGHKVTNSSADMDGHMMKCEMCRGCVMEPRGVRDSFGPVAGKDAKAIQDHCETLMNDAKKESMHDFENDFGYCEPDGPMYREPGGAKKNRSSQYSCCEMGFAIIATNFAPLR